MIRNSLPASPPNFRLLLKLTSKTREQLRKQELWPWWVTAIFFLTITTRWKWVVSIISWNLVSHGYKEKSLFLHTNWTLFLWSFSLWPSHGTELLVSRNFPKHTDWPWGTYSFLFCGYQSTFSEGQQPKHDDVHLLQFSV